MVSEIGSEFWNVPTCQERNDVFPEHTKWFLAGRTALKYIIWDCGIKSVSIPEWCCESMIAPFIEADVQVIFYSEKPSVNTDAVFIIDYFGYTVHNHVPDGYVGIVIRDMTHSIFSASYEDADYYFGSLRKWAGFWTGGFAWGNWKKAEVIAPCDEHYVFLRRTAMEAKEIYIAGKTNRKGFLELFKEADIYLKTCGVCSAEERDVESAKFFDWVTVKTIRRANAKILLNYFEGLFQLKENDCPLFVPINVNNRDRLRAYLIRNKIYCPVHWPKNDHNGTELSLICDQRYGEEDMLRICRTIDNFQKEESLKQ